MPTTSRTSAGLTSRTVANQSPNLDIKYTWGNSMPVYTIRGVGMQSFQASDTPSVGLFIDEVFQTSIAVMAPSCSTSSGWRSSRGRRAICSGATPMAARG